MASRARMSFDKNCEDVERLLAIHGDLTGSGPGRRYRVEVLNKSAVVLITAFWEAYCEDIAAEGLRFIVEKSTEASKLPKELQKLVACELKEAKHELAIWDLAGDGWRIVLRNRLTRLAEERSRRLNTPKTECPRILHVPSLTTMLRFVALSPTVVLARSVFTNLGCKIITSL
jgi:hypothetical protein